MLYNEEIVQVFSGVEDWSVHFIVENMNTGYELVNVNYPQEEWKIQGILPLMKKLENITVFTMSFMAQSHRCWESDRKS